MSKVNRILAVALACGVVAACGGAPAVAEVRTSQVTRGSVTQVVAVSGSVSSAGTVKLNPATTGKVAQLFVTVGQQVTAGQPLAKLDTTDLQAALSTAQNNLAAAQTNYDKALSGVSDAQSSLAQAQVSAANDIATAQSALAKLKANYSAAESTFTTLSTSLRPDVRVFTQAIDGMRIQIQQIINDMQDRSTPDVTAARNSLFSADTTLVNAQSYANTQLTSAINEYASARDTLAATIVSFDAAIAA